MFCGGHAPHSPTRQVAVFALLAFLFEECHIFERPREDPEIQAAIARIITISRIDQLVLILVIADMVLKPGS